MFSLIVLLIGVPGQNTGQSVRPAALVAAEARRAFLNAEVRWTTQSLREDSPRPVERSALFTKNEFLYSGDYGVVPTNLGPVHSKTRILLYEGEYWHAQRDSSLDVHVRKETDFRYYDVRELGLSAYYARGSVGDALWRPFSIDRPRTYETSTDGRYTVVTMTVKDPNPGGAGRQQRRWWIDPQRSWSVVRCQDIRGDRIIRESVSNLRKYGDVWFPQSVALFKSGFENGERPYSITTISSARFNDPSLPARLTPNDLGVEPGTNVRRTTADGKSSIRGWDGTKELRWRALMERIERGELKFRPNYLNEIREARAATAARRVAHKTLGLELLPSRGLREIAIRPTAWEIYVRRFIHHYELNDEQTARAWLIHRHCADQADRYLKSKAADFQRLLDAELKVKQITAAQEKTKKLFELAERRGRLMQRIATIFATQLKPRLEKLPTRAQRVAASAKSWDPEHPPRGSRTAPVRKRPNPTKPRP